MNERLKWLNMPAHIHLSALGVHVSDVGGDTNPGTKYLCGIDQVLCEYIFHFILSSLRPLSFFTS
jgi:hypothetical protein